MLDTPLPLRNPLPAPTELTVAVGERYLPAHWYSAAPPAGHRLVAALLLGRAGPWRLFGHLATSLVAHGYPVLALDGLEALESAELRLHAVRAAAGALEARAPGATVALIATADHAQFASVAAANLAIAGLTLIGTGLPPAARATDLLPVFDAAEPYNGNMLLLGGGVTELEGGDVKVLSDRGDWWRDGHVDRTLELAICDGPRATLPQIEDHALAPAAYVAMVVDFARQWLDRRFGPGYPRTWQGPPPTWDTPGVARQDGPAAFVPLLATGAQLLPAVPGEPTPWRLELPEGRGFGLTEPLKRLVALIDGHRSIAEIAALLSADLGRPLAPEQIATLVADKLAPLGVLVPDSRGEGGEDESGMTDILIRVYEPHDRFRDLLDNLTRVTRSPYNLIAVIGKRHCVLNQNTGLDRARTRYAVFLDDDVILSEGWLERLRETMDRTGAGVVSARQLRMNGLPLSSAAACGTNGAIVEALSGGACFMFRNDLGLRFDLRYVRSQWDDVDFMFELYERGYAAYVDGRADFWHHNEPKVWRGQNLDYLVNKWVAKGLLRGWAMYTYDRLGSAFMPCFGSVIEGESDSGGTNA